MAQKKTKVIWDMKIVHGAILDSFLNDPRNMMGNPVMFVVEVGSVVTDVLLVRDVFATGASSDSTSKSRSGCGSPCCSRISPKPWRKAGARRKPKAAQGEIGNRSEPGTA